MFEYIARNINTMQKIPVTSLDLAAICRLCMAKEVSMLDVFEFSTILENRIVDVIMKCAPVQISRCDDMPKFICQLCCTQLEKTHQFQTQIIQSDKTLRRYLQQLHVSDEQAMLECSIQKPSEDSLIDKPDVKFESLENSNVLSKIKVEQMDDNLVMIPPDSVDEIISKSGESSSVNTRDSNLIEDMNVNWKMEEPENVNSAWKSIEEIFVKPEIKNEPIDDSPLILPECIDDPVTDFSKGHTSVNDINVHSIDVGANREKSKNTVVKRETLKQTNEVKSPSEGSLKKSKHRHGAKKTYECAICNKRFTQASSLSVHKRLHTGEKPYQCDICKKRFTQHSVLRRHKFTHSDEKLYQCDICNKCYTRSSSLSVHKRTHTGEKPFQCDVCNMCFAQQSVLSRHKYTHTDERPYQCNICKKSFAAFLNLKYHTRIKHTGENPYQCEICQKTFSHPSNLKTHNRTHTGEKPYQCDICNKRFTHSGTLKLHIRTHTGEKPYQCDVCSESFARSSNLKFHKRLHKGGVSYQCDICNKYLSNRDRLNNHIRMHNVDKFFGCDVCNQYFVDNRRLKKHKCVPTEEKP